MYVWNLQYLLIVHMYTSTYVYQLRNAIRTTDGPKEGSAKREETKKRTSGLPFFYYILYKESDHAAADAEPRIATHTFQEALSLL